MTADTAIRVHGLEKSYQKLDVLRGVDFEVQRGSIFALLGSNGAGKTTLVRILSTLLKADAGVAEVDGIDVATRPADVREAISLTGQFAAVDEVLSGRENLELIARLRHLDDPGAIADELLTRFSLADAAKRRVATYSGGMRRRLDIAMSLIGDPSVIFLDEPTTGLDPVSRKTIWDEVRALNDSGTTVFLTTQYLEEADQLADSVGIIARGEIVAEGTPESLKAEIGSPHIQLQLADGGVAEAEEACRAIGDLLPPKDGKTVLVEVENGAADIPRVVRALDDAGIAVDSLELVRPTLDDVFVAKTGQHIEAEENAGEPGKRTATTAEA